MFPSELTALPQWVTWRYEDRGGKKPTKVPYNPITGGKASVNNPAEWTTYENVCNAMQSGWWAGIGFVLQLSNNLTFIDLDDPKPECTQLERDTILQQHARIANAFPTWQEVSPSGKGLHLLVRGTVPESRVKHSVELHSTNRYMCMTGWAWRDVPIAEPPVDEHGQSFLMGLWEQLSQGKRSAVVQVTDQPQSLTDEQVLQYGINGSNGQYFKDLLQGNWQKYHESQSQADFAFVDLVQFYSRNAQQIERIFMASALGERLRTGAKHKHWKYIPNMIARSFDKTAPAVDLTAVRHNALQQYVAMQQAKPTQVSEAKADQWEWRRPPGMVGEIAEFIYRAAPLPVTEVALAGALALIAGICGRSHNVSRTGLNLYILALAPTGTGKEAAATGIGILMDAVEETMPSAHVFRGPAEIASGKALCKHLAETSASCFSIMGEFGYRLHEMCSSKASTHNQSVRRVLLDMFHKSGEASTYRPSIYADTEKNIKVLKSPAFTILGESTLQEYYNKLDDSMVGDGLITRFISVEYNGIRPEMNWGHVDVKPPAHLVQFLKDLCSFSMALNHSHRAMHIPFTQEADVLSRQIESHARDQVNNGGENDTIRQLWNRVHLKSLKIAGILAIGENPGNPIITLDNLLWARDLIYRDVTNVLGRFDAGKVGDETGELNQLSELEKVVKWYLTPMDAVKAKAGVLQDMHALNVITHTTISRRLGAMSAFRNDRGGATRAIVRAVDALVNEGAIIEIGASKMHETFGKTMKAYYIVEPDKFK